MPHTSAPIQVTALDHVTLVVKDLEASKGFYCGILGMEDVPRPGFSFAGKWFQAGQTQIHLILQHAESGPAGEIRRGEPSTRQHHFAFLVDDANGAYNAALAAGATIVSPPKSRPDGAVQVFLQDPDGYVVELCQGPRMGE
jgi:catechol 2,3-dioxygenase-like lactoylglutathione lyase family enzyme